MTGMPLARSAHRVIVSTKETAMEAAGKVTQSLGDGSRTLLPTVDQASTHDVIDIVSDAARPVVDRIASGAHQAVDKIAGVVDRAAETLGAKGEQLKNARVRAMAQCRGYVRDHPVKSLGIAMACLYKVSHHDVESITMNHH